MFRNRSVVEIMVMTFTGIVGLSILGLGGLITYVILNNPAADISGPVQALTGIISGIVGALLGLLAGRSENITTLGSRPEE
jgi:hypothetical protein